MFSRSLLRLHRTVPSLKLASFSFSSGSSLPSLVHPFRSMSTDAKSSTPAAAAATAAPSFGSNDIQLFSLGTPNGQKVSIALEEIGVPYDAHTVEISKNVQFEEWFKRINPNSKIPTILDKKGPNGQPHAVFESGAILIYLAEKYGKLLPTDAAKKSEAIQWLFWQMSGLGPMMGQFNHFNNLKEDIPYAKERYCNEVKRLLTVLDTQLAGKQYITGDDYTIADIACFPWVNHVPKYEDKVGRYENINKWLALINARPATERGLKVTPR